MSQPLFQYDCGSCLLNDPYLRKIQRQKGQSEELQAYWEGEEKPSWKIVQTVSCHAVVEEERKQCGSQGRPNQAHEKKHTLAREPSVLVV